MIDRSLRVLFAHGAMRGSHLFWLLVMNLFWSGTYSAFKALSESMSPGEIVTLRYSLAALVLLLVWRWLPARNPSGHDLWRAALMGVMVFSIGPRLQVMGVSMGKAGDSSVITALEPLVTAVAATLWLREHVPWRRWIGFAIGMSGVLWINGLWKGQLSWPGLVANLVFISSFICEAAYSVMGKPLLARVGLLKVVGTALLCGTVANWLVDGPNTWEQATRMSTMSWFLMLYLTIICTLVGYSLGYIVIRETDVSLAAMTILAQPVFGIFIAAVTLGEALHLGQLWGVVAILTGLLVGIVRSQPTPTGAGLEQPGQPPPPDPLP
jgi:drug/metabolite transporter (DMT)-like permease